MEYIISELESDKLSHRQEALVSIGNVISSLTKDVNFRVDTTTFFFHKLLTDRNLLSKLTCHVLQEKEMFTPQFIKLCLNIIDNTLKLGRRIDEQVELVSKGK